MKTKKKTNKQTEEVKSYVLYVINFKVGRAHFDWS